MDILASFLEKSKKCSSRIVLPEANDDRIIQAARRIVADQIASLVLVGDRPTIESKLGPVVSAHVKVYDPQLDSAITLELAEHYAQRQKAKGLTVEAALDIIKQKPHFYGALLVDKGLADGMVCGADCTTAETLRATIHCIGVKTERSILSSFFIMKTNSIEMGSHGVMFFADCAVNPTPNPSQLASIAIDTAHSYSILMQEEPKVALLSFSTYGSAKHPLVDNVKEALTIAKSQQPNLCIDGEFQFDAAVIPEIGKRKAPGSPIIGVANCLIFPDLQSGNIGYKIAERIGHAMAIGPIIQGARKPVNDLSRGCSVDDIVYVTAITVLQANS